MKKRKLLRPADLAAAAAILLLGAVLFGVFRAGDERIAVISVNGETVDRIDLTAVGEPYTIRPADGVVLEIRSGAVAFVQSDCKGQDCVRCGAISLPGQAAACLPNRTVVRIDGASAAGQPDAVAY